MAFGFATRETAEAEHNGGIGNRVIGLDDWPIKLPDASEYLITRVPDYQIQQAILIQSVVGGVVIPCSSVARSL